MFVHTLFLLFLLGPYVHGLYMQDTDSYNASLVDWKSVISACEQSCAFEKRLCNYYIRTAFHDALSVTCLDGGSCGGLDGSLPLNLDEQLRPENAQFSFANVAAIALTAIASWYNASVADVTAVCGLVAVKPLHGPTYIYPGQPSPFLVGRKDYALANPDSQLPPSNITIEELEHFSLARNLTLDNMIALLGTHTLLQTQGCRTHGYGDSHWCDPYKEECEDQVEMFRWTSKYYEDACTPGIFLDTNITNATYLSTKPNDTTSLMCKFTNPDFLREAQASLSKEQRDAEETANAIGSEPSGVSWTNTGCPENAMPLVVQNCPHESEWFYVRSDSFLGQACQNPEPSTPLEEEAKDLMLEYVNLTQWNIDYEVAYKAMVNVGARYANGIRVEIDGTECPSGFRSNDTRQVTDVQCQQTNGTASSQCICSTEIRYGFALRVPKNQTLPSVCPGGYGSNTILGDCQLCPVGTFSPGGLLVDCLRCPYGKTTATRGTQAASACSVDVADPGPRIPTVLVNVTFPLRDCKPLFDNPLLANQLITELEGRLGAQILIRALRCDNRKGQPRTIRLSLVFEYPAGTSASTIVHVLQNFQGSPATYISPAVLAALGGQVVVNLGPLPPAPGIKEWEQCGGLTSSCQQDAPCPGLTCVYGLTCVRLSAWYHQCRIDTSLPLPSGCTTAVEVYSACGGRSVCNVDGQCPNSCCRPGFQCFRWNEWYHQCLSQYSAGGTPLPPSSPLPSPSPSQGCTTTLGPWSPCGGINTCGVDAQCPGVCCSVGYECTRQDAWYRQCTKSLAPVPSPPPTACTRTLDPWSPCGGINTCGVDAQCPGVCCSEGYLCVRQDEWYRQCRKVPVPST